MGRFAGFSPREVRRVAESAGWTLHRVSGDHFVFKKPLVMHTLSIPDHRDLKESVVRVLVKDMGISPEEFLRRAKK